MMPVTIRRRSPQVLAPGLGPLQHALIDVTPPAPTSTELIVGVPGRMIAIYELVLWTTVAQTLTLRNGSRTFMRFTNAPALFGFSHPEKASGEPWYLLSTNSPLVLVTSAAGQVDGYVQYRIQEPQ